MVFSWSPFFYSTLTKYLWSPCDTLKSAFLSLSFLPLKTEPVKLGRWFRWSTVQCANVRIRVWFPGPTYKSQESQHIPVAQHWASRDRKTLGHPTSLVDQWTQAWVEGPLTIHRMGKGLWWAHQPWASTHTHGRPPEQTHTCMYTIYIREINIKYKNKNGFVLQTAV